jgi:hypothetical protein
MDVDIDDAHKEMGDFEDEFEDEFESEDEIIEAGVDGRPDAEREAEERACKYTPRSSACFVQKADTDMEQLERCRLTMAHSSSDATSSKLANTWHQI